MKKQTMKNKKMLYIDQLCLSGHINFNNIIVTSSIFSGNGSIELLYEQDLFARSKFSFYRTNFNNLELKKLSNFFQKNLFLISNDINASIEIELSNIILYRKLLEHQ